MNKEIDMAELNQQQVIDYIKGISVLELSQLVKALESELGVSAAAAMPMAMPGGAGGGAAAAAPVEEKTDFNVTLVSFPADKKINIIVQVTRLSDGTRRVTAISELTGMEQDVITMHDVFVFEKTGLGREGKVLGRFRATGIRPKCTAQLAGSGIELPIDMFEHVHMVGEPQHARPRAVAR